jgi:hypothetical protein
VMVDFRASLRLQRGTDLKAAALLGGASSR